MFRLAELVTVSFLSTFAFVAVCTAGPRPSKIGVIVPLTGPLAEYGIAMQNGIKLAQQHSPEAFRNVEIVYEDSAYKPQTAISSFRKLISSDKVDLVMNFGCPTAQAVAPLAEQMKVPTAHFCSSYQLTSNKTYSFGMTSSAPHWAEHLWLHLESRKPDSLCFLLTENDYLVSEFNALKSAASKRSKESSLHLLDSFSPHDVDFRTAISKLKSQKCDALGLYLLPGQIRAFFQQLQGRSLALPIFGTDVFESPDEIAASKGGLDGATFMNIDVPDAFSEAYRRHFGSENQVATACVSHDLATTFAVLLADPATKDTETLMKGIRDPHVRRGQCGSFAFARTGGEQFFEFQLALKQVDGAGVRRLTTKK